MKKLTLKNIVISFIVLLVLLQFVRPERNEGVILGPNHIAMVVPVPADIEQLFQTACYDCHSNQTIYPWYTNIQPVGLWMGHHVDEGKDELNFSEFATYKKKRQLHKLDEVVEMIEEREMPLSSYTIIHKNARLTPQQQTVLINWAKQSKALLSDTSNHEIR